MRGFMNKLFIATALSISTISMTHADNGIYTSLKVGISDTKYKNSEDAFFYTGDNDKSVNSNQNQIKIKLNRAIQQFLLPLVMILVLSVLLMFVLNLNILIKIKPLFNQMSAPL